MNKKLLLILAVILIMGSVFYLKGVKNEPKKENDTTKQTPVSENEKPAIVATNPDPLEGAIVSGSQPVELVFNRSLENEGELKLRFEPPIDYKISLSSDRKKATITPQQPYELSQTYTLFVKGDSKFTGFGAWGEEKTFHFQTVKYRGI